MPPALRGCWVLDDPHIRDHRARLVVGADRLRERASWREGEAVATAQRAAVRSPTWVVGLFTHAERDGPATFATELSLGPDARGTPAGRLAVVEGDAGTRWYRRCATGRAAGKR